MRFGRCRPPSCRPSRSVAHFLHSKPARSMSAPHKLDVRIISDTICPWCWLGYKRLLKAFELAKEQGLTLTTSIKLEPFQLDPTLPLDHGIDKEERYKAKYGPEKFGPMQAAMKERGKEYGINFSYGGRVRQTTSSQRLLAKAYEVGGQKAQLAIWERIAKAYFEEEQDIGDLEMLSSKAAESSVMTKEEAQTFLESDELLSDYRAGLMAAGYLGVSGVPFFILNERFAVPGAVDPDQMVEIFKQAIA